MYKYVLQDGSKSIKIYQNLSKSIIETSNYGLSWIDMKVSTAATGLENPHDEVMFFSSCVTSNPQPVFGMGNTAQHMQKSLLIYAVPKL